MGLSGHSVRRHATCQRDACEPCCAMEQIYSSSLLTRAAPPMPLVAGARVLATNAEARKPSALLDDDSDTFLRNDCKADKWTMVELSAVSRISVYVSGGQNGACVRPMSVLLGANIDQNNEAVAPLRRFELVQNELYSSRVKAFEVYVRESHPRQEAGANLTAGLESATWKLAGNFTAQNQRGGNECGCCFSAARVLRACVVILLSNK